MSVASTIVKPANFAFAFGIPTSRAEFLRDLHSTTPKEFVREYPILSHYEYEFLSTYSRIVPEFVSMGALVLPNTDIVDICKLCTNSTFRVVVLISHWTMEDGVEFSSGIASVDEIIDQIPMDFCGVFDLCVCQPTLLAMRIRQQRPNCIVRHITKKASLTYWLYFFFALLTLIKQQDLTYFAAVEQTINAFLTA